MKINNYVTALINRMARSTGTALTDRHLAILEYAYEYYEENKVGPLYYNLKRKVGASKSEIGELFPHGLNSLYTWIGIPIQTKNNTCRRPARVRVDDYREVYLDHNATTYIRPEVSEVLLDYYGGRLGFANPSSSTLQGKKAYDYLTAARRTVGKCLSVRPEEIIFTGCGSEANNLAIKGIAMGHLNTGGHLITARTEHPSVLKTVEYLATLGFSVTVLDVEPDGRVSLDFVRAAIRKDTILVCIMAANNEIGTINPIEAIGGLCRERGIPFMVDAIQAFGKIPLDPKSWGISLLTFSGHKIYAPKGIGGLFVDRSVRLVPLVHGGGQELGIRSGTESVGHVMALARAAQLAHAEMAKESGRLLELRDFFLTELRKVEPDFTVNGLLEERIPNNLSIGFPHVDSGALLLSLNLIGICVSAGSACSAGKIKDSPVLEAIGADTEKHGTIRFSFGLETTEEALRYLFRYLPRILEQLKAPPP